MAAIHLGVAALNINDREPKSGESAHRVQGWFVPKLPARLQIFSVAYCLQWGGVKPPPLGGSLSIFCGFNMKKARRLSSCFLEAAQTRQRRDFSARRDMGDSLFKRLRRVHRRHRQASACPIEGEAIPGWGVPFALSLLQRGPPRLEPKSPALAVTRYHRLLGDGPFIYSEEMAFPNGRTFLYGMSYHIRLRYHHHQNIQYHPMPIHYS